MRKSWALCVLLGTLAWGQAAPSAPPPAANQAQPPSAPAEDTSASVPASAAVITLNGVCATQPRPAVTKSTAAKSATKTKATAPPADCKTVVTKAQFEKLLNGLAPTGNLNPQLKRQVASRLPMLIAMSTEAKKQHMDQTDQYKETVKFVQMQVLASELQKKLQAEAQNVPEADIQKYYDEHKADFEQYNLDRLFVPRTKQAEPELKDELDKNAKPTEEELKARQAAEKAKTEASEQAMTKLADDLRERAAKGEDFKALQKEAFTAAGMKIESPTVNLANVRRTGLAPGHAAVFELKPGEVSPVISDTGGHYIYKMNSKADVPFEQAKTEIHGRLQGERMKDLMEKLNNSYKVETNEAYFGPAGPGGMAPRPGPGAMGMGHGPAPRPGVPPATQQQAPPPAHDSAKH